MFKWIQRRRPLPEAQATPAPQAVTDVERLLHRLEWTTLKRLDGLLQGDHRTLMRGSGLDFADLREYQVHDDARHIDWLATARMQTPYVRTHLQDRDMTAWLMVDLSGSMRAGSGPRSKHLMALELCAVLSRLLTRRGNPVGALIHRGSEPLFDEVVPTGTSRRHVLRLLQILAQPLSEAWHAPTELSALLRAAQGQIRRRSTVFILSDCISTSPWREDLARLAQRHDVVLFRLHDPIESQLPSSGIWPLRDAETGELLWIDAQDQAMRRRFAELAQQREQSIRDSLLHAGVDGLELSTEEPLQSALVDFIRMRNPRMNTSRPSRPEGPSDPHAHV